MGGGDIRVYVDVYQCRPSRICRIGITLRIVPRPAGGGAPFPFAAREHEGLSWSPVPSHGPLLVSRRGGQEKGTPPSTSEYAASSIRLAPRRALAWRCMTYPGFPRSAGDRCMAEMKREVSKARRISCGNGSHHGYNRRSI